MLDAAVEGASGGRAGQATALAVHASIPPVLDSVVTAIAEATGNLSPTLAHLIHHPLDHETFLGRNGLTVERGFQVLVEALSTLLGRAIVHVLRNSNPVVRALLANKLEEELIFLGDPRSSTVGGSHGGG